MSDSPPPRASARRRHRPPTREGREAGPERAYEVLSATRVDLDLERLVDRREQVVGEVGQDRVGQERQVLRHLLRGQAAQQVQRRGQGVVHCGQVVRPERGSQYGVQEESGRRGPGSLSLQSIAQLYIPYRPCSSVFAYHASDGIVLSVVISFASLSMGVRGCVSRPRSNILHWRDSNCSERPRGIREHDNNPFGADWFLLFAFWCVRRAGCGCDQSRARKRTQISSVLRRRPVSVLSPSTSRWSCGSSVERRGCLRDEAAYCSSALRRQASPLLQ